MNPHAYRILVEGAGLEGANGEYMHLQHPGAEEGSVEFVRQDEEGYVYNVMRGKGTWYINRCNRDGVIAVYVSDNSGGEPWLPPPDGWRFTEAGKMPAPTVKCVPIGASEQASAPVAPSSAKAAKATKAAKAAEAKKAAKAALVEGSPKWYELRDPQQGRVSYLNLDTGENTEFGHK